MLSEHCNGATVRRPAVEGSSLPSGLILNSRKKIFSRSCRGNRVGCERMGCAVKKYESFDPIDVPFVSLQQTTLGGTAPCVAAHVVSACQPRTGLYSRLHTAKIQLSQTG